MFSGNEDGLSDLSEKHKKAKKKKKKKDREKKHKHHKVLEVKSFMNECIKIFYFIKLIKTSINLIIHILC